ncbi:DUF5615 family PIN-like protein [Jiangella gansuensis]|uniref:DUF5615 family PIN-like protein n=1 Tax=Jiangella gansuensis TaxID=281473 RepID=UPI0012FB571A|nr:DUF5615 family PIN-like protein [Jiangella gansuensis]
MPSDRPVIQFLLDEHYPAWLAENLTADGIDTVALIAHRPHLRGVDDTRVLEVAVAEHRVVVTEDVTTFGAAIAAVPAHVGVLYCHHARFLRTRAGLNKLHKALVAVVSDPPSGLGEHPVVWWVTDPG